MVKLNLYVGRRYDGYGEQVPDKQQVCLTNQEAGHYLEKLLLLQGEEYTKEWIKMVKGIDEEDFSS
jgi:hypothetical protein